VTDASFPRPVLVVSRCLGFEPVRYNAQIVRDDFVQRLSALCQPVVVCPEVEIGLGVPRPPIRLVQRGTAVTVVQPETGRDVTDAMRDFAEGFLGGLSVVDGFVLKSRSPSCGLRDVKLFDDAESPTPRQKTAGAFGGQVLARFPDAAVEDEGRLHDELLRERFLTLLFGLARLREVADSGERAALVDFHARYKYLMMAYEEIGLRELGRLVAGVAELPWEETIARYRARFARTLARPARTRAHVNALQHVFGPLSEGLAPRERVFFLDRLEQLRAGALPLGEALTLLRSWALRFENDYVERQAYFEPYPRALVA